MRVKVALMINRTRRTNLGEMLLDVDKYILTVVVIGGYVAPEKLNLGLILSGLLLAIGIAIIAIMIIPKDREE